MATKTSEIRGILSKNVKEQRKNRGFTLEKLAELTGLSVQTINDIEGGRRWVSDKTITKISAALNIESYQLLIADFFSRSAKRDAPIHYLLDLKKKILNNVESQIEVHFNEFLKLGILHRNTDYNEALKAPSQRHEREETAAQKPNLNKPKRIR